MKFEKLDMSVPISASNLESCYAMPPRDEDIGNPADFLKEFDLWFKFEKLVHFDGYSRMLACMMVVADMMQRCFQKLLPSYITKEMLEDARGPEIRSLRHYDGLEFYKPDFRHHIIISDP